MMEAWRDCDGVEVTTLQWRERDMSLVGGGGNSAEADEAEAADAADAAAADEDELERVEDGNTLTSTSSSEVTSMAPGSTADVERGEPSGELGFDLI